MYQQTYIKNSVIVFPKSKYCFFFKIAYVRMDKENDIWRIKETFFSFLTYMRWNKCVGVKYMIWKNMKCEKRKWNYINRRTIWPKFVTKSFWWYISKKLIVNQRNVDMVKEVSMIKGQLPHSQCHFASLLTFNYCVENEELVGAIPPPHNFVPHEQSEWWLGTTHVYFYILCLHFFA